MNKENRRQCRAITNKGTRCQNRAKDGCVGFCGLHFPKAQLKEGRSRNTWSVIAEVIATAAGIAAIVDFVVKHADFIKTLLDPFLKFDSSTGDKDLDEILYHFNYIRYVMVELNAKKPDLSVLEAVNIANSSARGLESAFERWFDRLPEEVKMNVFNVLDDPARKARMSFDLISIGNLEFLR